MAFRRFVRMEGADKNSTLSIFILIVHGYVPMSWLWTGMILFVSRGFSSGQTPCLGQEVQEWQRQLSFANVFVGDV